MVLLGLQGKLIAGIDRSVRTLSFLIITCLSGMLIPSLRADEVSTPGFEVLKVNHEFIDSSGYTKEEPGDLINRARYQSMIRNTDKVRGIRFFIHWKAPNNDGRRLAVKLEARGYDAGSERNSMEVITRRIEDVDSSGWISVDIDADRYKQFGKLMAWKVSLWSGNELKSSRYSFTWDETYSKDQVSNQNTNP